jgi:suppressor for copper-sensitivity B
MSKTHRNWQVAWTCAITVVACMVAAGQDPPSQLFNPLGISGLSNDRPEDLVKFSGEYRVFKGTQEGILTVKATISPTWHVYSTTQKAGGPLASRIKVEPSPDFELTRPFVADRPPHVRPPDVFPVPSEEFSDEVIWNAPFGIKGSKKPDQLSFTVIFDGQVCQDGGSCIQLSKVSVPIKFAGEAPPVTRGEFANPRIHAKIRGQVAPRTVVPGGKVTLTLTAEPAKNFHVYALADRDPKRVSKPALIAWKQKHDWPASRPQPSEPPVEHPGVTAQEPVQYYYEKPVTWTVELKVPEDAAPAGYDLRGLIGYQTCTNTNCDPPGAAEFSATVAVVKPGDAVESAPEPLTFKSSTYTAAAKLAESQTATATTKSVSSAPRAAPATLSEPGPETSAPPLAGDYQGPLLEIAKIQAVGGTDQKQSMFIVLPTAFLAGFILNFMPCVLPVIGLKIVSFVQQSGQSRTRIFLLNLWYSLGLLSVFLVLATLAVFAGFSWGQQFQSSTFNIVLASIVFAFALSFLGIWEIPVPGFIGTTGANKAAGHEGPVGAFFKGVLTTILATPCSGPMLVPALAWALKQPPALTYLAFICVGLGMAAPYLVIGAFPRLVSFLPKPGEWMETFKQLMGFVLLGTVVYLLTFIRMPLVVPTVAFMMGLWAALWWVGRVPVWDELNKRIRAWALGGAFAALIGIVAFNWLNHEMESRFERDVTAALGSPQFDPAKIRATVSNSNGADLTWKPYSLPLLSKLLLSEKKTVFLDFTADWCLTCKTNEKVALNVPRTKSFVEENGIETIKADLTYDSPQISELLQQLAGTTAIPVYAIFSPDDPYRPVVMEGLLTQSRVLNALAQASKTRPADVTVARKNAPAERTN